MKSRPDVARIAIVGAGIAGLTAAWQLQQLGADVTLFEATDRIGGTVETVQRQGFIIELGPDGWVSEKPWAAELAGELGLRDDLIPSLDADRVTYLVSGGKLIPMPDGMRMMVPSSLAALEASPLFSANARDAYAQELHRADSLRLSAPRHDESVASFVERHFGTEVLEKLAAPLLSGVFGGDVRTLSVRAVMPSFVAMEREHGSLILALQAKNRVERAEQRTIFTTLREGTQCLIDALGCRLQTGCLRLRSRVTAVGRAGPRWQVSVSETVLDDYDEVILATPAHITQELLSAWPETQDLLAMEATSAVIAAFAFDDVFPLPKGFGFLVPFPEPSSLLACTFTDQKFAGRTPSGSRLIRAFFGGANAPRIALQDDKAIAALAFAELQTILGSLPVPLFSVVRRWPRSLPQYAVGHDDRIVRLNHLIDGIPGLHLLGNAYQGVGLPDLVRDARLLARKIGQRG